MRSSGRATPRGSSGPPATTAGEWIYTNGIQQARGANTDGLHRTDYFKATDAHGDDPTHINRDIYNAVTYGAFGSHRVAHELYTTAPGAGPSLPASSR